MPEINDFNAIRISLASPEEILSWSRGEVTKPETINYRTLKPERDGLFCEKIFGPVKDWECYCGKYKRVRYKGVVCDKCGVEVTRAKVRRERMGHISLASPVSHIWFVKGTPSRLGLLLDISPRNLERVLYFAAYIITEVDEEALALVRERLQADYTVRRAEIEGQARGRGEDVASRISEELARMDEELAATQREIRERYAEQIAELEDEAQELRERLEPLLERAATEDIEFRGVTLAEKGEPISEYHLNRLDELVEGEIERLKERRDRELEDAEALVGARRDQREHAAEQARSKLSDEAEQELAQLRAEEKEKLARLAEIEVGKIISESEYRALRELAPGTFKAEMGAGAVRDLVSRIDLDALAAQLQEQIQTAPVSSQKRKKATKRLRVVEAFRKSGNKPEWMILTVLPVIPPDLRPMVQLDGGRFATSDLNDLYRRVINRNNRLKRLMELNAPEIIVRNEKRMLQEAVDALIDNGRRGRAVSGKGKHRLKSLSDMLKGKQGRFRQNLLGKRVDYSGRSVIVVGPTLQLHQCGLPKKMALELFKPFVMRRLVEKGHAHNIKAAKRSVERVKPEVWDALEEVIKDYLVLLNRAPSLHRLSIQAFEAVLIEGSAIQLHPLVCAAFNADFDGDQMAVHVPLSRKAQEEARTRMLSKYNLLSPAHGEPIITPAQDIVLGCFYLTQVRDEEHGGYGAGKVFASVDEAMLAHTNGVVHIQAPIRVVIEDYIVGEEEGVSMPAKELPGVDGRPRYLIETTVGRLIFNTALRFPDEPAPGEDGFRSPLHFRNRTIVKKGLGQVIADCYRFYSQPEHLTPERRAEIVAQFGDLPEEELLRFYASERTAQLADRIKALGFKYSTLGGMTFSAADVEIPPEKQAIMAEADERVRKTERDFRRGLITEEERYREVVETWNEATNKITEAVQRNMNRYGPIWAMFYSGARGNIGNIRQLAGIRGLMADPNGRIIETPIRASFREGLTVLEYFISTHGGRKGLADTAMRTADAGYLTRRLVDVAQDVIVTIEDCGTSDGQWLFEADRDEVRAGLRERIIGRIAARDIIDPTTGEVLVERNREITEALADRLLAAGVDRVFVRTPLVCQAEHGVCRLCYGRNLATGQLVGVGEAVGIIAAQSIGEPGTQLTLRTFHTGGVAAAEDITKGLPRIQEIFEARTPKNKAIIAEIDGTVRIERHEDTRTLTIEADPAPPDVLDVPADYNIVVQGGALVETNQVLAESNRVDSDAPPLRARMAGIVSISEDGRRIMVYAPQQADDRRSYVLPHTARLRPGIQDGAHVTAGTQLTEGSIDPQELLLVMGKQAVQTYLVNEAQKVYRDQGVPINDKHIEIIVRQMLRRVRIEDPGDTDLLPSELIDQVEFQRINRAVLAQGGEPALGTPVLLGLIKASLTTDSFLAAASFQETTRVLTEAAINGKVDYLRGLKENVVIGKLIPAGTGLQQRRQLAAARAQAAAGDGALSGGAVATLGGDGVAAGGDGMTRDEFAALARERDTSVLDNLMLDALFNRQSSQLDAAIDRLDESREPAGIYSDPQPLDETDRGYFENAAPNDQAEARAEAEARRHLNPEVADELADAQDE
ncbi:DNA-directed RNA polymerase subunit beta' [Kallotenue papyrolyticum]|uniref:DNA-directed RNA polymerase subunit beta' n=1 Tax=Kallotenue papyrolyticum TaxID=1325125 RepID=UPI0004785B9B|nr:DNA-directed RNA polymerase subunit beta' [Kallotenue papyrolyticum]